MKRSGLTLHLLAATLILAATPRASRAEEMMSASPGSKPSKRAQELLQRFDKNGDGKLDDDERADAKEAMLKEQVDRQMARAAALPGGLEAFRAVFLEMFDKNRDGMIDDDEHAAAERFAASREGAGTEELKRRFDKDGNGKIDAAEQASIDAYLTAVRGSGSAQMRDQLLRRFDRNANGKIDDEEMTQLEEFVRPRIESTPAQLRRYDANGDGKLDEAEWKFARLALTQWLNGTGPAALAYEAMHRTGDTPAINEKPRGRNADEDARLKAVADEVARRRATRDAAKAAGK